MIAEPYDMQWRIRWADEKKKMAVLCTKEDHALMEMLWATVREDLNCTITTVISNHTDLKKATESLGFTFHHGMLHYPLVAQLVQHQLTDMLHWLFGLKCQSRRERRSKQRRRSCSCWVMQTLQFWPGTCRS